MGAQATRHRHLDTNRLRGSVLAADRVAREATADFVAPPRFSESVKVQMVIVTGPMGVGKTTVAKAAQRLLGSPWLFYEVDRSQPWQPSEPEFVTVENDRMLRRANLVAARAYVDAGFPIIVEMDLSDDWGREIYDDVLAPIDSVAVALVASRTRLLERAQARGDDLSTVTRHLERGDWTNLPSAIAFDTSDRTPEAVAEELVHLVRSR